MKYTLRCIILLVSILFYPSHSALAEELTTYTPRSPLIPDTIQWGVPGEKAPMAVLYIAPQSALSEAQALQDRFHVECTVVALANDGPQAPDLQPLTEALKAKHQVIIVAHMAMDLLPESVLDRIFQQVTQGTGLLLAHCTFEPGGPFDQRYTATVQETSLPEVLNQSTGGWQSNHLEVQGATLGNGRVAWCTGKSTIPSSHGIIPPPQVAQPNAMEYYSHAYAYTGKLILYLGRSTPARTLIGLEVNRGAALDLDEIPPWFPAEYVQVLRDSTQSAHSRTVALTLSQPGDKNTSVKVQLRREGFPVPLYTLEEKRTKGLTTVSLPLVAGPGFYVVDAWLMQGELVVDWFSQSIQLGGWPVIESLELQGKQSLRPNDVLEMRCMVRGSSELEGGSTLYAQAIDAYGRVVAQSFQILPPMGGNHLLRLNLADLLSPLLRIEVGVIPGEHELITPFLQARGYAEAFYIPVQVNTPPRDLRVIFSSPTNLEDLGLLEIQQLQKQGFTHMTAPAGPDNFLVATSAHLALIPEVATLQAESAVNGTLRQPCLTNSTYLNNLHEQVRKHTQQHLAGTEGIFSLGAPAYLCASEEPICQSPTCQEDYLARERDWPLPLPDDGTFQRWQMNQVFAQTHNILGHSIAQTNPQARSGFLTTADPLPQHGYDWHALTQQVDFLAIPAYLTIETRIRSWANDGSAYFLQASTAMKPEYLAWHTLLHGYGGVWTPGTGDVDIQLAQAIRTLPAGLAPLIQAATQAPSEIQIFESTLNTAWRSADMTRYEKAQAEEAQLLRTLQATYPVSYLHGTALGSLFHSNTSKAIMVPPYSHLREQEIQLLYKVQEQGIALIVLGTPTTFNLESEQPAHDLIKRSDLHLAADLDQQAVQQQLMQFLDTLELQPTLAALQSMKTPFQGETFRYSMEQGELIAFLAAPEASKQSLQFTWEKDRSIYDLRLGEAHHAKGKVDATLQAGEALVLAKPNYSIEKASLQIMPHAAAAKRVVLKPEFSIEGTAPKAHWCHLTVRNANGDIIPWHTRNILLAPSDTITLPLHLYARPDTWSITLRDVLTGTTVHLGAPEGQGNVTTNFSGRKQD